MLHEDQTVPMSRSMHARLPISAIGFRLDRPMFESARPILRARRILIAPMLALALLTLSAGGALGNALAAPDGTATTVPTPTGYDISYPQCGSAYPRDIAFGVVGVTRGLPSARIRASVPGAPAHRSSPGRDGTRGCT